MTALNLPKNQEVSICASQFRQLIKHLRNTIELHLEYLEDDTVTKTAWKELQCNGIEDETLYTIDMVAHMLNITDSEEMTMGNVIRQFFQFLPVLKQYYKVVKCNKQSIRIRSLTIKDMRSHLEGIKKQQMVQPKQTKQIQLTMTQVMPKATEVAKDVTVPTGESTNDEVSQQGSDTNTNAPVNTEKNELKQDVAMDTTPATSNYDSMVVQDIESGVLTQREDDEDNDTAFIKPKRTIPIRKIETEQESETVSANKFDILQSTEDDEKDDKGISFDSSSDSSASRSF